MYAIFLKMEDEISQFILIILSSAEDVETHLILIIHYFNFHSNVSSYCCCIVFYIF
uniref:Uncharacterized protein n=1 Tax=Rhizophora mucronata TaxID=61149 RepID=A0A2P2PRG8_RHIMU